MQAERIYWLAWSRIPNVGPVLLKRIYQHFGTLADAWSAPTKAFWEVQGFGARLAETVERERSRANPEQLFEEHARKNPHFWTPADLEYPRLLWEIPSPPPVLYYKGRVRLEENQGSTPTIGIVGTRHPTEYGCRWTRKISALLARHGFAVVSGMAAGIDGEAHESCLEAGGRTLAILGTGVDVVYPQSNRKLYERIIDTGLILSEYPAGTKPDRGNFPARNRIIAGLSRAVLVMEAPSKSGALITANFANDFDRDVYVLPGSLDNQQSSGSLSLLNRGASAILGEEHLLELLGAIPQLDSNQQLELFASVSAPPPPDLSPELARVLGAIAREPVAFDAIVENTKMKAATVSSALLELELSGLVSQVPGMRYRLGGK